MPIINGIYTKDFPDLGRDVTDTDLLIIAVVGDNVTYKTTLEDAFPIRPITLDSSGEYDCTAFGLREFPSVTIYDSSGNTAPYYYNNTTKKITNGNPGEAINVRFI